MIHPINLVGSRDPTKHRPPRMRTDPLKLMGSRSRQAEGINLKGSFSSPATAAPRALRARPPTQGAEGADAPLLGRSEGADSHRTTLGLETAARPARPSLCSWLSGSIDSLSPGKWKKDVPGPRPQSREPGLSLASLSPAKLIFEK